MAHLINTDRANLKKYKTIDIENLQWIHNLYGDIPYKFELGIEEKKIKFYITKNWQILTNNTNEKKILSVFEEVLKNVNKDRNDKLSKTNHDNMTDILESMGVIHPGPRLSRYQKIMITISSATVFIIGVFSYLNWAR